MIEQLERQPQADLRPLLRKPFEKVFADLSSSDLHTRGLALEALAFKLMHPIGLTYVATRLRGIESGGTEVALIFESTGLVFSRWQIQCRNTDQLSLDDVAREVGFAESIKSDVIVVVTVGEIGHEARSYANRVLASTSLRIVLVDGVDIAMVATKPPSIARVLEREAGYAMRFKKLEASAPTEQRRYQN